MLAAETPCNLGDLFITNLYFDFTQKFHFTAALIKVFLNISVHAGTEQHTQREPARTESLDDPLGLIAPNVH